MKTFFTLCVLAICLSCSHTNADESDKWYSNGDYDFFFSNTQLNQKNAKTACTERNAVLAKVDSDIIQAFLTETIRTIHATEPVQYYIGLERGDDNTFHWTDQSKVIYSAWQAGEPNNAWWSEYCGELTAMDQTWNDLNCDTTINFICQRNAKTPKPVDEKWYQDTVTKQQYYISTTTLNFDQAILACVERRSTLVMIKSDKIQSFLRKILRDNHVEGEVYYIGMHRNEDADGRRTDLEWIDSTQLGYVAWAWNEPNDAWFSEDCGELLADSQLWNDGRCWDIQYFICAKPL